ncbi:DoxX family protein [Pedobacter riviphilus]|uniref:DoxX family protein n=1 Tax=Pedobacter riviphilus TaxID=2766984 RepID=A0ABX6THT0_9SPHI|nr:DoxX family protein [Pedobacter riviphilus]QNR85064.1 DoxX family protein [Pedobacter riviphilus]
MSQKTIKVTGWILTAILGLLLTMSATMKITLNDTALAQAVAFGINTATYQFIGVIEILSLLLFIIPRTGMPGTMRLVAYLGGAIVTHLQHQQPIAMVVSVQALLWATVIVRFPELGQRIFPAKNIEQL